jgi:signal transduction histidine kinase
MERNRAVLRESVALRFENAELLRQALEARDMAVEARQEAERATFTRTRFLAAASHDLRQPVQALSLFADTLSRVPESDVRARQRAVESLVQTTGALRGMFEGLFDISRLDAGLVSAPRAVRVEPLLAEVVAALRDESESRGMVIHARGRPATVLADPALLARVLHNLAANAVRHAGRGRVLLAVRLRAGACTVQVWDQGPGIAERDRERIFEEFVQIGDPERERPMGLGLGLSIVRRICDESRWALQMKTAPGHGTMFSVIVPLAH